MEMKFCFRLSFIKAVTPCKKQKNLQEKNWDENGDANLFPEQEEEKGQVEPNSTKKRRIGREDGFVVRN